MMRMYSIYRTHDGKIHARKMSREEIRERALYWAGVHLVTVVFFVACCAAAGVL